MSLIGHCCCAACLCAPKCFYTKLTKNCYGLWAGLWPDLWWIIISLPLVWNLSMISDKDALLFYKDCSALDYLTDFSYKGTYSYLNAKIISKWLRYIWYRSKTSSSGNLSFVRHAVKCTVGHLSHLRKVTIIIIKLLWELNIRTLSWLQYLFLMWIYKRCDYILY